MRKPQGKAASLLLALFWVAAFPLLTTVASGSAIELATSVVKSHDSDTRQVVFDVDFLANASRLSAFLDAYADSGPQGGVELGKARRLPNNYLLARFPNYRHVRVGNLFMGYECSGAHLTEMATRGSEGVIRYQFGETIELIAELLRGGMKPRFALTGIPKALVPPGERLIRHPAYGCVNAPAIDWTKREPKDRMSDWWALQDAFMSALIARFGYDEVKTWGFATWTEPFNVDRKSNAHLVLPKAVIDAGRHDESVATILATSIDVAMKHRLPIHIGNLAGPIEQIYPRLIREIRRFPKGNEYLQYIDGYAISRYRTNPKQDIGRALDRAFELLKNPEMPEKPLYIDEFGELVDDAGIMPFGQASSVEGVRLMGALLTRVFDHQDGTTRVPKGVAFWPHHIAPRSKDSFPRYDEFLKSPAANLVGMFASLNGFRKIDVGGAVGFSAAGTRNGVTKIILIPALMPPAELKPWQSSTEAAAQTILLKGFKPNTNYKVLLSIIDSRNGNPISAFTDHPKDYRRDRIRFANDGKKWKFASAYWERCFFDEIKECVWRDAAHRIEGPLLTGLQLKSDKTGSLKVSTGKADILAIMFDIAEYADGQACPLERGSVALDFNSGSDTFMHLAVKDLRDISLDAGVSKPDDIIRNDERNRGFRLRENSVFTLTCVPGISSNRSLRMRFRVNKESAGSEMVLLEQIAGNSHSIRLTLNKDKLVVVQNGGHPAEIATFPFSVDRQSQWNSLEIDHVKSRLQVSLNDVLFPSLDLTMGHSRSDLEDEPLMFVGGSADGRLGFQGVIDDLWIGQ